MKKMTKIVAGVIAAASLLSLVACQNGVPEKEIKYVDYELDLDGYITDIDYYPTFVVEGSQLLGVTEKNAKLTIVIAKEEGASWYQWGCSYGNNPETGDGWELLKWAFTDPDGGKIAYDADFMKPQASDGSWLDECTAVYKLSEAEAKKLALCGLVIQGANCELKSVTISYEGDALVNPDTKTWAKTKGTLGGDAELVADVSLYDSEVVAAVKNEGDEKKEKKASYTLEGAVDAKLYKSIDFVVRAFNTVTVGKPVLGDEMYLKIGTKEGEYEVKDNKAYKIVKDKDGKLVASEEALKLSDLDKNFKFYNDMLPTADQVKDEVTANKVTWDDSKKDMFQVCNQNWTTYKAVTNHGLVVEVKGTHAYKDKDGKDATKAAVSSFIVPDTTVIGGAYQTLSVPTSAMYALDGATALDFSSDSKDTIESINIKFGNSDGVLFIRSILFK